MTYLLNLDILQKLQALGYNDAAIAKQFGCSQAQVAKLRNKLGLEPIRIHRKEYRALYTIYDRKTSAYLCEGTSSECAKFLGIKEGSLARAKTRFEHGQTSKYEIYKVTAAAYD